MGDWRSEGANADALGLDTGALADAIEATLETDDGGAALAKALADARRQPPRKVSNPMSRNDSDDLGAEIEAALGRMSASDQRTLRKFLLAVSEHVGEVKKSASSDFLAELKQYLTDYLRELGAIPDEGGATDPFQPTRFVPGGKPTHGHPAGLAHGDRSEGTIPSAIQGLAKRLMAGIMKGRSNLIVAEQDMRGFTTTASPLHDALEDAARRDMQGERFQKDAPHADEPPARRPVTGGLMVHQDDFSTDPTRRVKGNLPDDLVTDPVASAAAERERVRRMRPG
jgi:hypothetical protein